MWSWLRLGNLLAPVAVQCFLCSIDTDAAQLARMSLLPIAIYTAWDFSHRSAFEPMFDYVPLNVAFVGILPFYSGMKSLEWAFAPASDYQYTGPHLPKNRVTWFLANFTSMRGIHWSWGSPQRIAPPLAPDTPSFLLATIKRSVSFHFVLLAASAPVLEAAHSHHGLMAQLLQSYLGYFYGIETIALLFQGLLLCIVCWSALEFGQAFNSLLNCLLHLLAESLGLVSYPFDVAEYPPLLISPLQSDSLRDFWTTRWHSMFRRSFVFLGFSPGQRLGNALGSPRLGTALGVLLAFGISGIMHEYGVALATRTLDPTFTTTLFFLAQGVGTTLEFAFTALSGRRVKGRWGKLWAWSFLLLSGSALADSWLGRQLITTQPPVSEWLWYRWISPCAPTLPATYGTKCTF